MEPDLRYFTYGAMGLCLVGTAGVFISGGQTFVTIISAFFCMAGAALTIALFKYGYFIVPFLTKQGNIVQIMEGDYEIPPAQDVILKHSGGLYYASAFLGIKLYESTTEKTHEENVVYSEYFERAISSVRFPVKFSMMVYVKDLSKHRMKWETRHAEAQLRLSREREKPEPDVLKIDRFEKEIAMCEAQLNRIIAGEKPMGAILYAMTTSTGISKDAASAAVKTQASELKSVLANALNVEVEFLIADEMLRCFDWEHIIPSSDARMEQAAL
ncbi:MAG: hypothetical protein V1728_04215 [Candidatus Micrarchaeota archaeon]